MKKRICIYCDKWGSGGIEAFLLNVLEHMDVCQFEINLVVSQLESVFYLKRIEALGVTFRVLSNSVRKLRENHRLFREILEKQCYDVVYFNLFHALSLSYVKDAKTYGVPFCIVHSHNNGLRKSIGKPVKLAIHTVAKYLYGAYGDLNFACSAQAGAFLFLKEIPWKWIPNGIEVDRFSYNPAARMQLRKALALEGKLVLGNVGRLCYQKNQSFLLKLLAALLKEREDVALLLIGDGEDREMLQEKTRKLRLENAVTFLGNRSDVALLYQAMDVFLFPSHFEGLGIVAVEAQASGLPVDRKSVV